MIYLGLYILLVAYLDWFVGIPAHLEQKEDNKLLTLQINNKKHSQTKINSKILKGHGFQ